MRKHELLMCFVFESQKKLNKGLTFLAKYISRVERKTGVSQMVVFP